MKTKRSVFFVLLPIILSLPFLPGCGCGFDCSDENDDGDQQATITIGLSDSQPEDLEKVVIEIDSIILRRNDPKEEDVVISSFTVPSLDETDAETIPVDLLNYPGSSQLKVVQDQLIDADFYDEIFIGIISGDDNSSYVVEKSTGMRKKLNVAGDGLTLSGREIMSGDRSIIIEFGLARALQYKAADDSYLLGTEGVRVLETEFAAQLSGTVASELFNGVAQCSEKGVPESGNRVYLYQGRNLASEDLADVHTTDSKTDIPAGALAPFAVATMLYSKPRSVWEFFFGYLPADDYTLAFSCYTEEDDSVEYDGLNIPLPFDQLYEISLSQSERRECNLTVETGC